ncbi:MAG: glycosyltransferase [Desulfurococcus sp.]|nr:glycosyltransferase [Desulfurococcus sp.]
MNTSLLVATALILAIVHFTVPLAYYLYLKRWLNKPWDLKVDYNYTPKITIILPTYNEAGLIQGKLDDIYAQDYPRDRIEVLVVDSASSDGTPRLVEEWAGRHRDLNVKLIVESERRGKAHALNNALKHASSDSEIIVVTDADSWWLQRDALRRITAYLSDPRVGAVSCLKKPEREGPGGVEEGYRGFYNTVRLAESKLYSTPVFHGELEAFRKKLLVEAGGFPLDLGSDDSHTATRIAVRGWRTIIAGDVVCVEKTPLKEYLWWRVRRAQHLIQHFMRTLGMIRRAPGGFKSILAVESYLHLVNPWILLVALILLVASIIAGGRLALIVLLLSMLLLAYKPYRTWITTQAILVIAAVRNLYTKDIIWEKQEK